MAEKTLYRSRTNRMLGGVAGGIAEYFVIDPTLIRIGFVILGLALNGVGIVAYLLAWLIIPEAPLTADVASDIPEGNHKKEAKTESAAHDASEEKPKSKPEKRGGQQMGGFILIAVGLIFLLQRFVSFDLWNTYWPLIVIVVGFAIILRRTDRKE
jgi:phage shock protein C